MKKKNLKVTTRQQAGSLRPRLRRDEGIPLYKQIAAKLADRISSNELKPGDKMPSETQLRDEFHVSRVTVRQAIMELAQNGNVAAHQGKGTFVTVPAIAQTFQNRTRTLIEAFSVAGVAPEVTVVSIERITPSPLIAAALQSGSEMVMRLCRLYKVNDTVVAATDLFLTLPLSGVAYILAEPENIKESSYAIIEKRLGIKIGTAKHTIKTIFLDRDKADVLGMREGEVCLSMDRVTYSEDGKILQFMQFFYPPGRMSFETTLSRQSPGIELRVPAHD